MNLDSLKDLLLFLNFTQHQSVFTKEFTSGDHSLSIDFDKKEEELEKFRTKELTEIRGRAQQDEGQ